MASMADLESQFRRLHAEAVKTRAESLVKQDEGFHARVTNGGGRGVLIGGGRAHGGQIYAQGPGGPRIQCLGVLARMRRYERPSRRPEHRVRREIGRASCRERV